MNGCVCPGDTLIYECTAMGVSASTIWTGSALDCVLSNDDIVLLHRRFLYSGSSGTCNNGAIVARGLSIEGNNYTSQLSVIVTPDTAGKTIVCASDNGIYTKYLFSSIVPVVTGLSLV